MAINLTPTRLTGLSSGMDTDSIIKSLMQIEQLKVNRSLRSRTTLQWRQDALKTVKSDITDFKDTYLRLLGSKSMMGSNTYKAFDVNVTGGKSGAVTVSANYEASAGTLNIYEVKQLAKAASASSSAAVSKNGELASGNFAMLKDLEFANELQFETVDGSNVISFSINGKEFTFKDTDTLQSMMNTINGDPELGVTMSYSRLSDKISFATKEMGEETSLNIVNLKGNAFGAAGAFGISAGNYENGQDAIVLFEDKFNPGYANAIEVKRASNNFKIDGVIYTLNKTTSYADDGEMRIDITANYQSVIDKVKEFVEGYNTMIAKLESMISDRKTIDEKSYIPLTDEEKASMTEKQIEDWEKIAKKGILYNDAGIRAVTESLRSALYQTVESAGLTPADIGLRTGNYFEGKKGQISLDEDALRAALEKDADKVMNVFIATSSSEDKTTAYKQSGLMNRINTIFDNYTKESQVSTFESIDRSMRELNTKISSMQEKMIDLEEKYYLKYAAMEKALADLQNQSTSLVNMLGMNNK
ncbi:MAG: flagellar filament capping protein FliD [Oscillospiraceae bacterium]|jgi:flagellar hook-associated protein 2|nr:flagellar filament capping protein FliD [Oscillospiraceae bacterium]